MKTTLPILSSLLAALAFAAFKDFDVAAWSLHGWIALGRGSTLSLLVGGALMALMFHSARKGYDGRIGGDQGPQEPD